MPAGSPALRLVHYWWPLVVGWSATWIVRATTARPPDPAGLGVLLCGIVAAYSLDRVTGLPNRPLLPWVRRTLIVTSAAGTAVGLALTTRLPATAAVLVPVLGAIALAYPGLKRVPGVKNLAVPLVWTWAAIGLPFHDGSWFGWRAVTERAAAPLFLLFAAGVLLCDVKDERTDRRAGVPTPVVLFGARTAAWLGVALAAGAAISLPGEPQSGLAVAAVGLGLAASRPGLLATDVIGPLLVDVCLSVPGLLIAWHRI